MKMFLLVAQIVLSLMIVGAILLQAQGSGISPVLGGGGEHYHTRRGIEKYCLDSQLLALYYLSF